MGIPETDEQWLGATNNGCVIQVCSRLQFKDARTPPPGVVGDLGRQVHFRLPQSVGFGVGLCKSAQPFEC